MISRLPRMASGVHGPGRSHSGHVWPGISSLRALGRRIMASLSDPPATMDASHIDAFIAEHGVVCAPPPPAVTPPAPAPLKCIVFLAAGSPLLVVLRLEGRVAEAALARHLGLSKSRLSLAPVDRLVELTGYPVGQVPPFGHCSTLRTVVDSDLVASAYVGFGGDDLPWVLTAAELLRATRGDVAAVSVSAAAAMTELTLEPESAAAGPLPRPWAAGAQGATLVGVIAQKRKIANLLLFLNIVPPLSGPPPPPSSTAAWLRRLWAHPDPASIAGTDAAATAACEVQLILGKTLERRMGRPAAESMFKALRVGQAVRVTGRPQPHIAPTGGPSRAHVVDLVVHEIEILDQGALQVDLGSMAVEEEEEEEEGKRRKSGGGGGAISPELAAILAREVPAYTMSIPQQNVVLVEDLEGLRIMGEVLLAHQRKQEQTSGLLESASGGFDTDFTALSAAEIGSETAAGLSVRARERAERRRAAAETGAWRPALVVGMDCEWQPTTSRAEPTPVALLQVGTDTHVFLVDTLALCHEPRVAAMAEASKREDEERAEREERGSKGDTEGDEEVESGGTFKEMTRTPLTPEQAALSDILEAVLGDRDIIKMGFGLRYDFKRLAESFPWLPCFGGPKEDGTSGGGGFGFNPSRSVPIASHVDALLLARAAGDGGQTSYKRLGLAALCRVVLARALDKSEQTSDWGTRPLAPQQLAYAAADVACLVEIYSALTATNPQLFSDYWMAEVSGQLTDMAPLRPRVPWGLQPPPRYVGSAATAGAPGVGLPPGGAAVIAGGRPSGPTQQLRANIPLLLRFLGGELPAGGKLEVVRLAAAETPDDPEGGGGVAVEPPRMPRFPRGSGLLEFSNQAFLLFVNVPSLRYPNLFTISEDACTMTWWPGKGQTMSHPVIRRLLPAAAAATAAAAGGQVDESGEAEVVEEPEPPTVLLFVRPQRDGYVCCGRMAVASVDEVDGQLCVSWILKDYTTALRDSRAFQGILQIQRERGHAA